MESSLGLGGDIQKLALCVDNSMAEEIVRGVIYRLVGSPEVAAQQQGLIVGYRG